MSTEEKPALPPIGGEEEVAEVKEAPTFASMAAAEESFIPEGLKEGESIALSTVDLPELPRPEPTVKLWVGTTRDSPVQNVTVGGVTFPAFHGPIEHDSKLEPIIPKVRGARIELTEKELARVKERIALQFVRMRGKAGALVVSRSSSYYRPSGNDVPLGRFLFAVVMGDRPPSYDWQETDPPPMWQG